MTGAGQVLCQEADSALAAAGVQEPEGSERPLLVKSRLCNRSTMAPEGNTRTSSSWSRRTGMSTCRPRIADSDLLLVVPRAWSERDRPVVELAAMAVATATTTAVTAAATAAVTAAATVAVTAAATVAVSRGGRRWVRNRSPGTGVPTSQRPAGPAWPGE